MPWRSWVAFLLVLPVACNSSPPAATQPRFDRPNPASGRPTDEPWSENNFYFFSDRRDSELEHLYAVRDHEVAAQVALFPGYGERKWYRATLADDFLRRFKTWSVRSGDILPPFLPHGPWYARITLTPDKEKARGEAWFRNDSQEVQAWFEELQHAFVKHDNRVDRLPDWIEGDERIKRYFGY